MGRMTKYLKQSATLETHQVDSKGQPMLDEYGQPLFSVPNRVKCRKEVYKSRSNSDLGQYVDFANVYYFDASVRVSEGDRIDGHEVRNVSEYYDGMGVLVGYEVIV